MSLSSRTRRRRSRRLLAFSPGVIVAERSVTQTAMSIMRGTIVAVGNIDPDMPGLAARIHWPGGGSATIPCTGAPNALDRLFVRERVLQPDAGQRARAAAEKAAMVRALSVQLVLACEPNRGRSLRSPPWHPILIEERWRVPVAMPCWMPDVVHAYLVRHMVDPRNLAAVCPPTYVDEAVRDGIHQAQMEGYDMAQISTVDWMARRAWDRIQQAVTTWRT